MIGFLPELYEDELFYSWVARYYCHSGYSAYSHAAEDFFLSKKIRPDIRFLNTLNEEARAVIAKRVPMERIVLEHTMFPVSRFTDRQRLNTALTKMTAQEGDVNTLLPIPKREAFRNLRFCPACAKEDRELYGETYWHRCAFIPHLDICPRHRCRLIEHNTVAGGTRTPRLFIAEVEIGSNETVYQDRGRPRRNVPFAHYD